MADSTDRILTTHVGSLPRPPHLIERNFQRSRGSDTDEAGYQQELKAAVAELVAQEQEAGVDIVNDGEFGHSMGHQYDYGPWWTYIFQRLGGLELRDVGLLEVPMAKSKPGAEIVLGAIGDRREWMEFGDAYMDKSSGVALPNPDIGTGSPVTVGPITYQGQEAIARRHRELQGGARRRRARGRLPQLGRARELRALRQRVLRRR